jgi:hypothetical protein
LSQSTAYGVIGRNLYFKKRVPLSMRKFDVLRKLASLIAGTLTLHSYFNKTVNENGPIFSTSSWRKVIDSKMKQDIN